MEAHSGSDSFWSALPASDRTAIQEAGRIVSYERGDVIMSIGAPADGVLIIRQGRAHVVTYHEDGATTILAERGAGEIVGEIGVMQRSPRGASVIAISPVTAIAVERTRFRHLLQAHSTIAEGLFAVMAARLNESDRHRAAVSRPVPVRLVLVLLELAEPATGDVASVHIGLEDLCRYVGASRAQVYRALRELRTERLIETAPERIRIASLRRLRERYGAA